MKKSCYSRPGTYNPTPPVTAHFIPVALSLLKPRWFPSYCMHRSSCKLCEAEPLPRTCWTLTWRALTFSSLLSSYLFLLWMIYS